MVLTLLRKELRETRAFAAVALGLYLIYVSKLTGHWSPLLSSLLLVGPRDERGSRRCPVC